MPNGHPPTLLFKTYTPKTLEPFNGQNGQRILLAIKGIVYDVTAGRNFYGPSEWKLRMLEVLGRFCDVLGSWYVCQLRGTRRIQGYGETILR